MRWCDARAFPRSRSARLIPTSVARTPRGSRRLKRPPSCLERFGLLPWWDVLPLRAAAVPPPAAVGGSALLPPPPPPPTSGSPSRALLKAKARFSFICGPPREPELCDDGSVLVSDTTLAVSSEPPPPQAGSPEAAKSASEPVSVHDLRCGGALRRCPELAAEAAGVWRRKEPSPNDVDMSLLDGVLAGVVRCVLGGEQGGLGRLPVEPSRFRAVTVTPAADVGAACCGAVRLALFAEAPLSADGTNTSSGARSEGGVGRRRFGRPRSTDDPAWLLGLEPVGPSPSGLTLWY